jgi:hypothetical protein
VNQQRFEYMLCDSEAEIMAPHQETS